MLRSRRTNIGRRTRNGNAVALQRRSQTADERAQPNASQGERNRRNRSVDAVPARRSRIRRAALAEMMRAAFNYNSHIDYSMYGYIGMMDAMCPHCDAANFPREPPGMCCANGKLRLPALEIPPEPLYLFILGTSQTSKNFLSHIQQYNSPFQMISVGATKIIRDHFMATFKTSVIYGRCLLRLLVSFWASAFTMDGFPDTFQQSDHSLFYFGFCYTLPTLYTKNCLSDIDSKQLTPRTGEQLLKSLELNIRCGCLKATYLILIHNEDDSDNDDLLSNNDDDDFVVE